MFAHYFFMEIKFITPNKLSAGEMGVYKITFDNYKFYIGSSSNLKSRFANYRSYVNNKTRLSKPLQQAYNNCKFIKMEVLEIVHDVNQLKNIETFYIENNFNEKILNRAKTGISNKGINWTIEERLSISKSMYGIKRSIITRKRMSVSKKDMPPIVRSAMIKRLSDCTHAVYKINHYNSEGVLLATYKTLNEASNLTKLSETTISTKVNNGKTVRSNGDYFKRAEKDAVIQIIGNTLIPKKKVKEIKISKLREDIDVNVVIELIDSGKSRCKIAKEMKTYPNTIRAKIKKHDYQTYERIYLQ